jgi:type 1 glutamine amidotransferase
MKSILLAATAALATVALAPATAALAAPAPTKGGAIPGGAMNQNLGDPDYGVCRGVDPACYHNWPRAKTTTYRALLVTRTAGPRHADLGPALPPGLNPPLAEANVVQREMVKLAKANGFELDYTEDLSMMQRLVGYNAVIFFSTSRDNLDDGAKTALRQYMRAGGGFVGIHNAFGTNYNWPWYEGLLGNANFYDHGPERTADVVVLEHKDASTKGLPARFGFRDEWYNLVPFPTRVRFLATVDEASYGPGRQGGGPPPGAGSPPGATPRAPQLPSVVGSSPGHGTFHPVAWCQYYDGGKAWLTTLGHDAGDFATDDEFPGAKAFQSLIIGGIKSTMGMEPFCQ